jgi:hypothetical protein
VPPTRFERARDPDYWAGLCRPAVREVAAPPSVDVDQFRFEGWLSLPPILQVDSMRDAVSTLVGEGWLPVFSFVYDAFWEVSRTRAVQSLLSALLGPDTRQKPNVWAHHVELSATACGWPPHVDLSGSRDLTLWIPLSDATLDNGCVYLIPSNASAEMTDPMPRAELLGMLQSARAVPARAGSILCWRQDVLHWGSYSSPRATGPRISIALEFGPGGPPRPPPSFEERLAWIGRAIRMYLPPFEPGRHRDEWLELADQL